MSYATHCDRSGCDSWSVKPEECELRRTALFPDCQSDRASRHLLELRNLAKSGLDVSLIYFVSRGDVDEVKPSHSNDEKYARNFHRIISEKNERIKILSFFLDFKMENPEQSILSLMEIKTLIFKF